MGVREPAAARGYRWGKFQGWATVVIGLITWLPSLWPTHGLLRWLIGGFAGGIMMLLGLGLVHKRRIGLVLLYAQLPICIAGFIFVPLPGPEIIFAVCWYFIPAIFYYPKRWKEFSKYGDAPSPPKPTEPEQPLKQPTYLPDFGKHLANIGTPQNTMFMYPTWEMDMLQVVGLGRYCATLVQPHEGKAYCATFDFGDDALCEILKAATPRTLDLVTGSLIEDPESIRSLPLPDPINVGVAATLGEVQQGLNEMFIPLVIMEVFGFEHSEPKN